MEVSCMPRRPRAHPHLEARNKVATQNGRVASPFPQCETEVTQKDRVPPAHAPNVICPTLSLMSRKGRLPP